MSDSTASEASATAGNQAVREAMRQAELLARLQALAAARAVAVAVEQDADARHRAGAARHLAAIGPTLAALAAQELLGPEPDSHDHRGPLMFESLESCELPDGTRGWYVRQRLVIEQARPSLGSPVLVLQPDGTWRVGTWGARRYRTLQAWRSAAAVGLGGATATAVALPGGQTALELMGAMGITGGMVGGVLFGFAAARPGDQMSGRDVRPEQLRPLTPDALHAAQQACVLDGWVNGTTRLQATGEARLDAALRHTQRQIEHATPAARGLLGVERGAASRPL